MGQLIRRCRELVGYVWSKLVRVPYWTDVRWISNSPAARLVILIPLVGYWIILNNHVVEFTRLSRELVGHDPPGDPWRLFATYFGLCGVAVASALYQIYCPNEVKAFPSASAYVAGYFSDISGIEMRRVDLAVENGDQESQRMYALTQEQLARATDSLDDLERRRANVKRNTLQIHYDLWNRSNASVRRAMAVLYRLGFLALAVPSIDIFIRVSRALAKSVLGLV